MAIRIDGVRAAWAGPATVRPYPAADERNLCRRTGHRGDPLSATCAGYSAHRGCVRRCPGRADIRRSGRPPHAAGERGSRGIDAAPCPRALPGRVSARDLRTEPDNRDMGGAGRSAAERSATSQYRSARCSSVTSRRASDCTGQRGAGSTGQAPRRCRGRHARGAELRDDGMERAGVPSRDAAQPRRVRAVSPGGIRQRAMGTGRAGAAPTIGSIHRAPRSPSRADVSASSHRGVAPAR